MPDQSDADRAGGFPGVGLNGAGAESVPQCEARLLELLEEFRRRQRRRPDLAVRPWWTPGAAEGTRGRVGFVVEYCPGGRESAELVVRLERVTVEGPAGVLEAALELDDGWFLEGAETGSPETLANHLLRLADRSLGEAA